MILVIGASSFIGGYLMAALGSDRAIGTYRSTRLSNGIHFDAVTMRLTDVIEETHNFTHAVILYAEPDIDACKRDIERSRVINVDSTSRVIEDLVKLGIKPIFTSSEYVFEGTKGNYSEEDTATPTTIYGSQKLEIEKYLESMVLDYTVLRLAKVYSTDPSDNTILSGWLRQIHSDQEIRCAADQIFSPIHVGDVTATIEAIINLNLTGIFNVGGPEPCSRLAMLRVMLEHTGLNGNVTECSIKDFDFLDLRPLDLSMNIDKLIQLSNVFPRSVKSSLTQFNDSVLS